jgi:threonine dehydratase
MGAADFETRRALVGIELGSPDDLAPLLTRLDASPINSRNLDPDDPVFRFLV